MCLNLVDCIILSMLFSNSFNSSTGGGFLADLKPYVSLVLLYIYINLDYSPSLRYSARCICRAWYI